MKNFEKHIDAVLYQVCGCMDCKYCNFKGHCENLDEWLLSEYEEPIELTDYERNILSFISVHNYSIDNISECYIARDKNNSLYIHAKEPKIKYSGDAYYNDTGYYIRLPFDSLFKFIQFGDEKIYKISELLEK